MDASKEECQKVIDVLNEINIRTGHEKYNYFKEFLEKVKKKLPSQVSIEKDRGRNRRGKKGAPNISPHPEDIH